MASTFLAILPQTLLLVAACLFFLGGTTRISRGVWGPAALFVFLLSGLCLAGLPSLLESAEATIIVSPHPLQSPISAGIYGGIAPNNLIRFDTISLMFQWVFLLVGALFAALAVQDQHDSPHAAEFYALLLSVVAGLMLTACANELVLMFLSLELISIPTYVLLYLGRRGLSSQESATKYFLLSVLSAAILLYGFSFLYGLTGTTNLSEIREILTQTYTGIGERVNVPLGSGLGKIALVLIFAGLGFKIAAVPFHFYAPDVYQGTTPWNAGLLAVAPKAAGFLALVRIASHTMVGFESSGETIALILAIFTMTAGNVLALLQTNVRRMLAYSSIAHAGYMLIGIAVGFWNSANPDAMLNPLFGLPGGVQSCLFYLIAYSLVTIGLFAVLVYLSQPGKQIEEIDDLTGLWRTQPVIAIAAALFLFSLAGIPPLPGFWGKLTLFAGTLSVRVDSPEILTLPKLPFIVLAVVGVANAAIAGVYYLRLVAVMFLHEPLSTPHPGGGRPAFAAVCLSAVLTVLLSFQVSPVLSYLRQMDAPNSAAMAGSVENEQIAVTAQTE